MTLSGNSYPTMSGTVEDVFVFPSVGTNIWLNADVTDLFNEWLNGTKVNHGFGIDPSTSWGAGQDSAFVSSESAAVTRRPLLEWTKSGRNFTAQCAPDS